MSNEDKEVKTPEQAREETAACLRKAMAADEKIDSLKMELSEQLKVRSDALEDMTKRGIKKFSWKGTALTIFRKGEGLFSLKGKKKEEKDLFSLDG